jgi:hypothetical protein
MRFTLHYEGIVPSGNSAKPQDKHMLREVFHEQIKNIWSVPPLLHCSGYLQKDVPMYQRYSNEPNPEVIDLGYLPDLVTEVGGIRFASIAHPALALLAELSFTFHFPHNLFRPIPSATSTDIDNRLKTLLDALSVPRFTDQLPKGWTPTADQVPLHCLLFNDDRVVSLSARVEPCFRRLNEGSVLISIGVILRPKFGCLANLSLLS